MARQYNTDNVGRAFSPELILAVWQKATAIPGLNPDVWRVDPCGARMRWDMYGNTDEKSFGWEVDHIRPVSSWGTDNLSNLQALQWQNNRIKGDSTGQWQCAIVYGGV